MKPLNILIIAGGIYPQISPRSYRTTELAKGLAKLGHNVTVYAILGNCDYTDFEKKYNLKVRNLGKSYFGNANSDGVVRRTIFNRVLAKLFYNVIDYPRIEYFFKTIKVLKKERNIDYLITIAHPFGIHWGTAYYRKNVNDRLFKIWSSDCGDPFMGDPDVSRWKLFLKPIEKFWCKQTDYIVIPVENGKHGYYEEFRNKIAVIPQGIDFSGITLNEYVKNEVPTFLFSGAIYPGMRDPSKFLDYLSTLVDVDFKFIVYVPGNKIFEDYQEKLGDKLEIRRYIERSELIRILSTMDFLININNDSLVQTPSKLIDYSLSKRPIINISTSFPEEEKQTFNSFLKGDYTGQYIVDNISQYDILNVSKRFIDLYDAGR